MAHKYSGHAKSYIVVWVTLLVLTAITVAVSYHNFGNWNIFVAMLVATIKGALVCLYFMHLKYDNRVNQVVFASAFVFLGIFIALTGSDEWFRAVDKPIKIQETAQAAVSTAEENQFRLGGPELIAKGKAVFAVQCVACHGAGGKGDGPAAAALNPKPRDFTSGYWRFGGQPTHVFKTITDGSPGTAMASFAALSVADRWALVATVRSFSPNAPGDTPEDLKAAGLEGAGGGGVAAAPPKLSQTIPISFAMKQMAQTNMAPTDTTQLPSQKEGETLGQRLYQAHCMSCHGAHGKGGLPVSVVSLNPRVYLKTQDLAQARGVWVANKSQFVDLVSNGLPGRGKPGIANFSDSEWDALYQYVLSLTKE